MWNNAGVQCNSSKQSTINLGLNSFWSDNNNTAVPTSTQPSTNSMLSNNHPLAQQKQQRLPHKLDDTEFDITEIVDKILPYADDSGIKLD